MLDVLFRDHGSNLDVQLLKLFVFGTKGRVVSLSMWNMTEACNKVEIGVYPFSI